MSRAVWLWVPALLSLAGCVQPLPGGEPYFGSFDHDGRERTFTLYSPPGLDAPAPLLIMLHGGFGDGDQLRRDSHMDLWADEYGFRVVYPDGVGRTWNAAHCCGSAYANDVDDVGFLVALIDEVDDHASVLRDRVGVAGHSNGAFMAQRAAAERPMVFRTMASVAGTMGGQITPLDDMQTIPQPARPVHALLMHANDDEHVQYEGGRSQGVSPLRVDVSFDATVAHWAAAAQARLVSSDIDPDGVRWDRMEGLDGTRVWAITTEGGHGWPGGTGIVETPIHPDASQVIAAFFAG